MKSLIVPLLLTMLLSTTLTTCSTLADIIETEPPAPTEASVVRLLCAQDARGNFIFGDISQSRSDVLTEGTQKAIDAHNAAWDTATKNGELCGKLGAAPFGGVKWGTK